jgi:hypothetical protein
MTSRRTRSTRGRRGRGGDSGHGVSDSGVGQHGEGLQEAQDEGDDRRLRAVLVVEATDRVRRGRVTSAHMA